MENELQTYLHFLFDGLEGYVYSPVKSSTAFTQKFFSWPSQVQELEDWITTSDRDPSSHVYISPAVYESPKAVKDAIKCIQVVWVDFDSREQIDFKELQVPSALIQSSISTKLHCYWKVPTASGEVIEEVNRRLAYYLEADGGGWDAVQLLRPPSTTNRKYSTDLPVKLVSYDEGRINDLADFDVAPTIKSKPLEVLDYSQLPSARHVMSTRNFPTSIIKLIKLEEPPVGSRSSFLSKLAYELAEEGLSHLELVSILHFADERIGKFSGRPDQFLRLTQLAEHAMFKVLAENSIAIYSYEDILFRTKDLEWILEPWLHKTGLMLISSAPNVGKTQLTLQMVTTMLLGERFLDLSFGTSMKHSILFMSLEMPKEGVKYILDHQRAAITHPPQNFHVITESGTLTQYENLIEETGATVVLIDSLKEILDEIPNDSEQIRARTVLKWVHKVSRRHKCAFIIIHHNRKPQDGNKKPKTLHDLAGSLQFGTDSDTVVQLWEDHKGIEVSLVKCRYGEKEVFYIQRDKAKLWFFRSEVRVVETPNVRSKFNQQTGKFESTPVGELDVGEGFESVQSDTEGTDIVNFDFC